VKCFQGVVPIPFRYQTSRELHTKDEDFLLKMAQAKARIKSGLAYVSQFGTWLDSGASGPTNQFISDSGWHWSRSEESLPTTLQKCAAVPRRVCI